MLTREQILEAEDRPTEVVVVPEWGGTVVVRTISGLEQARLEDWREKQEAAGALSEADVLARLLILTIVDAEGQPLFTRDDAEALKDKGAPALLRVLRVARRLNGLGPEDVDAIVGNSSGDRSDGPGSD